MVRFAVFAVLLTSGLAAATSSSQATLQPPDTTVGSDPESGELIPSLPAPAVTTAPTVGSTRLTEQSIIALARMDAGLRHYRYALIWEIGGGLAGVWATGIGGVLGFYYTNSFLENIGPGTVSGILLGAAVGALSVPLVVSLLPVSVPETPQLEDAAPDQREIYRQTFIGESRSLRKNSVATGERVIAGAFLLYIFSL